MNLIEAARQALEALESLFGIPDKLAGGGGDVAVWRLGGSARTQAAIEALRKAIAEVEKQEPVAYLAWREGQPSWDEDCVCQDPVYPVDEDDDRTSMPVYLHPAQNQIDAARYRWLRDPCSGAQNVVMYGRGDFGAGLMSGSMLDDAIDAAIGATK